MPTPFREQVRDLFVQELGPCEVIAVAGGELWRWVLKRPHNLDLYITIDSPEMPDIAHLIVSDPSSKAVEPVISHTVRTLEEAKALLAQLKIQWGNPQ